MADSFDARFAGEKTQDKPPPPSEAYAGAGIPGLPQSWEPVIQDYSQFAKDPVGSFVKGIEGRPPAEDAAQKRLEVGQGAEKRARELRERALQISGQPTPQAPVPRFQGAPQPPDPDRMRTRSALQDWKSVGIMGALMFSGLAKGNMRNAMSAATGLLEGYQAGDKERVERERQIWKDQTEAAIKQNEIEQKTFDAIMDNAKLSMQDKIAQVNTLLTASGDEVRLGLLRRGDISAVEQMQRDREKWAQRLGGAVAAGGSSPHPSATPEQINDYAKMWLDRGPTALPKGSMRDPRHADLLAAIQSRGLQLATEQGIDTATLPFRWQKAAGRQVSAVRFDSGRQGDTIRSLNVVIDHLSTIDDLARALKNGEYQLFNRIANSFAKQVGKPEPTNITAANAIVGTEVIKALGVAGAGTMAERLESAGNWSALKSPEQLLGATAVVKRLLSGQLLGLRQEFTSSDLGSEDDFNRKLFPKTIEELEKAREKPGASGIGGAGAAPSSMSDDDLRKKLGL